MADLLVTGHRRQTKQLILTAIAGFLLGGLLTEVSVRFLPDSATRTFLTTSVAASINPFSIDVVGVALTMSLDLYFNFLTLVGFAIVAAVVRSWL